MIVAAEDNNTAMHKESKSHLWVKRQKQIFNTKVEMRTIQVLRYTVDVNMFVMVRCVRWLKLYVRLKVCNKALRVEFLYKNWTVAVPK